MIIPALIPLLGISILGLGGGPDSIPAFPVEAEGDIHFQLDGARFIEGERLIHEIYLSIPQDELRAVSGADGDSLFQIEIRLGFKDAEEKSILSRTGKMDLPRLPSESGEGLPPAHTLTFRPEIPEGTRRVEVSVTDPNAGKRGLYYEIQGIKKNGRAEGWFGQPAAPARPGFSDLLYVWSVGEPAEQEQPVDLSSSGRALRERILPNPAHFYGLYHGELTFYVEIYPADNDEGGKARLDFAVMRLSDSTLVRTHAEEVVLAGHVLPIYRRFDLGDLEGGTYTLRISWRDAERGPVRARISSPFQLLWEPATWYLTEKDLLEDASILLSDEQYRAFVLLDRGNKELYMERFWKERDPTPQTAHNEVRREFLERKRFAESKFGGFRKGKLSDRGRIYIRFGQPDEIEKELGPNDRYALEDLVRRELSPEERDYGARPGSATLYNRSYEVWYYHLYGDPLLPEYVGPNLRPQMKFIFVDQTGIGEYTLLYTNVFGGYN